MRSTLELLTARHALVSVNRTLLRLPGEKSCYSTSCRSHSFGLNCMTSFRPVENRDACVNKNWTNVCSATDALHIIIILAIVINATNGYVSK